MGNEKLENVYRILYRENCLQMLWMLQNKKRKTYIKLIIFIERYHEDKVWGQGMMTRERIMQTKLEEPPKIEWKNTEIKVRSNKIWRAVNFAP